MAARLVAVFLLSASCTAQSSTTATTPATSVPDLEDPAFIGYYVAPTTVQRLAAGSGSSWVTSGKYAGDCSETSDCVFATACAGETAQYNNGGSVVCSNGLSCVAFTIFQSSPGGLPSATNIGCRAAWVANTVYRELPSTVTSTVTSSSTLSASVTGTTKSVSSTTAGTTQPASSAGNSGGSGSNAWIAGAVIGPIAAVALIGLLICFFARRKQKIRGMSAGPTPPQAANAGYYYPTPTGSPSNFSELHSEHKHLPQEMAAYQTAAELPTR
ncbi:uncharacterized protein JN550_009530 [Neoarthrinium moseri]|uniref:uncharacterized protein n=1 Tax=Neoarthrinium moseri TaxID=1658444 RepID=UPI001FDDC442|nr:uncharacterized protein JN550_009530 [Neoarthrinium moseri]KAI1863419.1 hypothetical protein JN550_009530 [Neoarthrinium moseri]